MTPDESGIRAGTDAPARVALPRTTAREPRPKSEATRRKVLLTPGGILRRTALSVCSNPMMALPRGEFPRESGTAQRKMERLSPRLDNSFCPAARDRDEPAQNEAVTAGSAPTMLQSCRAPQPRVGLWVWPLSRPLGRPEG